MKIVYEYSHLGGVEIMQVRHPQMWDQVRQVITSVEARRLKISKEKTMLGRALVDPKDMNIQFKTGFETLGFHQLIDKYNIQLEGRKEVIRGCYKQIDFSKDKVLVEVQFGKYAFMFYDMAKFQYFYNENKADVGIEIVPCHSLYKSMSSGVSYGEQLINDIERLKRHFPAVPVAVLLIDENTID
ncbi:MAG: BglII/BstYI family type II restriction endonuclease [Candidatus Cloacimonadaceae bacterium]|nr:BglII/BstYI family type II restriction endonuclease [Candidatus Cloacimonadaceae bacterium]MDP3114479.1 BglII/BstYI family type II restriction endonuclease [Candidatus Cloacimonadaceae bacterium]